MTKIIITIEIGEPKKKGPRDIIVSGAPAGEMPIIKMGLFADRHVLTDAIYAELQRREPQVPKHTKPESEKKVAPAKATQSAAQPATPTADDTEPDEADDASEPATEQPAAGGPPPEGDQLVAPDDLPVINEPAGEPQLAQAIHSPLEAAIYATKSE